VSDAGFAEVADGGAGPGGPGGAAASRGPAEAARKEARSSVRPRSGTVAQPDVSLDAAHEDGGATPLEGLEGEGPSPEDLYVAAEERRHLRHELAKVRRRIGEMGWEIIHSRLARDQPMTLEEIGRRWGVSRERVRQIEMRTKLLLSRHLARVEAEEEAEASMARAS
jgi:RNA polymerase primary sigma factor